MAAPEVWKEGEDLGWDPVDRRQRVPQGPNRVEELRGILFKGSNLKHSVLQPLSTKDVLDPLVSPHPGSDRWMP